MEILKLIAFEQTLVDSEYKGVHKFVNYESGVPVYEVKSIHGLNRIIGYAKYINRDYGEVLYRGECKLHNSLIPSLLRGTRRCDKRVAKLNKTIDAAFKCATINRDLGVEGMSRKDGAGKTAVVEATLQHYGIPTRYLDLVDNHWIALWMSANRCVSIDSKRKYYRYEPRLDTYHHESSSVHIDRDDGQYGYLLLVCIPDDLGNSGVGGVRCSDRFVRVDLRQALPSIFHRPHAQHGLVVRKKGGNTSSSFDMANQVVGIIQIRVDRILSWLGNGELLTQENLFPSPCYDQGYDALLMADCFNRDEADKTFSIARFA